MVLQLQYRFYSFFLFFILYKLWDPTPSTIFHFETPFQFYVQSSLDHSHFFRYSQLFKISYFLNGFFSMEDFAVRLFSETSTSSDFVTWSMLTVNRCSNNTLVSSIISKQNFYILYGQRLGGCYTPGVGYSQWKRNAKNNACKQSFFNVIYQSVR